MQNGKALGQKESLELGSMVGVHICRSYMLMTPHGQTFVDALVKGLPEAYLHSPDFWERIEEPLTDWIAAIVHNCYVQLKLEHRAVEMDIDPILGILK